jgi:predicted Zn finger-like uncharacterized protein
MFTVCPKCALTLVVTPADLRVAQGYVRCGRCSNVFNAIVGLSEDRSGNTPVQAGTASTSTIRKAPALADMPPERFADTIPPTPPAKEISPERFADTVPPERFADTVPPKSPAVKTPIKEIPPERFADTGASESEEIYAGPEDAETQEFTIEVPAPNLTSNAPPPKSVTAASPPPPVPPPPLQDLSEDAIPDAALEFNPEATDVTQVFIEAPAKRIDLSQITGQFEQIAPEPEPASPPLPPLPRAPPPVRQLAPPSPPPRDPEDVELEDELRSLAARLDATGKQPVLKTESSPRGAKSDRQSTPKLDAANDDARNAFAGSPYNSADDPANIARKAAASAARRGVPQPADRGRTHSATAQDDEIAAANEVVASEAAAELTPRRMPRRQRLAWIGGSAALGLVLVAQAIHHNRNELATNPRLNRPLTSFYSAIGVPLVPRWNLALYDVRQLGAFSGGGDDANLTVRASLKNNAGQPLPLPLLRITVQDRYGNRIATRDVPPKSYVPGALPADAHLGAGQRIDAEVTFKDPGRDAVGFEIDACLPTAEGRIACANDAIAAARR